MFLTEIAKSFLSKPDEKVKISSTVTPDNVLMNMGDEPEHTNTGFFDGGQNSIFSQDETSENIYRQKSKIDSYRKLAMNTDVNNGVDEIVNEIIFSYDDKMPIKVNIDEENDKLVEAITDKFKKITGLLNIKRNLFRMVKQGYVDGELIFHCAYNDKKINDGIQAINMINPCLFYFDQKDKSFQYMSRQTNTKESEKYSKEEIVREDFGLKDGNVNLGYLEYAIKPANTLKTLEDLLVPLRFSRSVSRRVFNVDIAELPNKRGTEVMNEYQNKFKYKKFYNNETGEVSNQQHITSMVEDYWFSNRSGGRGTEVSTLDETGNLGELDDILYNARKLYRAMKIPVSRLSIDPDSDSTFDFQTTQTSNEDMKFFMFISRLRQVYSVTLKEILKREVISTGIMTENEWKDKEESIEIVFTEENKFIEKMKLDAFMSKFDLIGNSRDFAGKFVSYSYLLKEVLKWNDEDIKDSLKEIQKEKTDPLMKTFYEDSGY